VPEDVLTCPTRASELTTNGVGPWKGLLPTEPFYDPVLLENGDSRNVVDRYRYWLLEAIVADLDESRHPFHVAIENWQHDMNIGSIVRSAQRQRDTVHRIIGIASAGISAAHGHRSLPACDVSPGCRGFCSLGSGYRTAGDRDRQCARFGDHRDLPFSPAASLLFGQEGPGLSAEALACATAIVEISRKHAREA
jgi:hypothetical protein